MLARALASVIPLLSPDVIVIGGGVALAGERLLEPLRRELEIKVHSGYRERIALKAASLNEEAGVIGSALYAKQRLRVQQGK
ncbi:D-allose kinase [compost metagenome]